MIDLHDMTIYDLPLLDERTAFALVQQTLGKHPQLLDIFPETFLHDLVPRRHTLDNFLLLLLVQPDDPYATAVFSTIVADLETLKAEAAYEHFRDKFHKHEQFDFMATVSELGLAAFVKRLGISVDLEPPTNQGIDCDFRAGTQPVTYWEIKAVRDLDFVRADERVYLEVQRSLRRIPQPLVLHFQSEGLALNNVGKALSEVKGEIAEYYAAGGKPPTTFTSHGLRVEITGTTERGYGYLGTMFSPEYVFESEQMERIVSRIARAATKLPPNEAGVVVIDTTMAHWIHPHEIVDACFGEEVGVVVGGVFQNARRPGGAFRPGSGTRVSAVLHYANELGGGFRSDDEGTSLLHNPYARNPLPAEFLTAAEFTQYRRVDVGNGRYRLASSADLDQREANQQP